MVEEAESALPTLIVSVRSRTGVTDDGDSVFSWMDIATGPAIVWQLNGEVSDLAGTTRASATATMLYDGGVPIPESSIVASSGGGIWRAISVAQWPDRLEMDLVLVLDSDKADPSGEIEG